MDSDLINLTLLIFRVMIGGVLVAHGYNHIFRGGKIDGTAGWFESLGMRPGKVHAWLASLAELAGGAALILGLLTPLGGAAVIGTMTVALITNHRTNGFFIFNDGEGWEYVATLIACGLVLATVGAGQWSLDHAIDTGFLEAHPGAAGFWIAIAGGFGGAATLLALFWRPAKS